MIPLLQGEPEKGATHQGSIYDDDDAARATPAVTELVSVVSAVLTGTGPLGMTFSACAHRDFLGACELVAIVPGSQAQQHLQLCPGLVVSHVAGVSVAGQGCDKVKLAIKGGERPLSLGFSVPEKPSHPPEVVGQKHSDGTATISGPVMVVPDYAQAATPHDAPGGSPGQGMEPLFDCECTCDNVSIAPPPVSRA